MPTMPRVRGRATQIAYSILGTPANQKKRGKLQRKIDRKLNYEETRRVK